MNEERKIYALDEYQTELTNFIGQDKIAEFDALPNWSDERFHSVIADVRIHADVAFNDGYSYQYVTAVEGLSWGYSSSRISASVRIKLQAMKVAQLIDLLYTISENCTVQGEVPRFVNEHLWVER